MTFNKTDLDFLDDLFDNLLKQTDNEMIDLHDDDSCDDHLQFEKLSEQTSE